MKTKTAEITQLWDTGINIITPVPTMEPNEEGNIYPDFEISNLDDLRACTNVIVGSKIGNHRYAPIEVLIDDQIVYVSFRTVSHPTGCGKLRICEV